MVPNAVCDPGERFFPRQSKMHKAVEAESFSKMLAQASPLQILAYVDISKEAHEGCNRIECVPARRLQ